MWKKFQKVKQQERATNDSLILMNQGVTRYPVVSENESGNV